MRVLSFAPKSKGQGSYSSPTLMMLMFYLKWSGDKYEICKYSGSGKNFNFLEVPLDAIIVSKDTSTERL